MRSVLESAECRHIEVVFDEPNDLTDECTIAFDCEVSECPVSEAGTLLHLGYFKLTTAELATLPGGLSGAQRSFVVIIKGSTAKIYVDNVLFKDTCDLVLPSTSLCLGRCGACVGLT
eukprot:SAG11_NODE_467_length_9212_cov_2.153627_2_plen_117_part_00